jgi:hypothetical protein
MELTPKELGLIASALNKFLDVLSYDGEDAWEPVTSDDLQALLLKVKEKADPEWYVY